MQPTHQKYSIFQKSSLFSCIFQKKTLILHPILETSNQNHNKMKRFLTFLLAVIFAPVLTMNLMAAKTEKQWNFELNDEGECIIEHVFTTSKADGEAAMKAFKKAMNKQTFESRSVISEEPGQSIHYALTKNTKSRYNPFAGNFREAMKFKMDVTYRDGKIYVKLYDLSLENEYEGYGKNVRSETFSGKLAEYEEAEADIKAGAKGKAKKDAQDTMDNISDSFNECQLELNKLFDAIQKSLE